MDGYRVFTWSPTRFPAPARLLTNLRAQGFKAVTIIDPGVKADPTDPTFAEGVRRDYFIRRPDGTLFTGVVWPGESSLPTSAATTSARGGASCTAAARRGRRRASGTT